ncbi:MAG: MFS transporter [Oceanospirillum sp.]|nr:MFS transporter [Oceanospirillum sp.]
MLGNGLINILLPVRMQLEQMSTDTIGMVLSLYYVGMLAGSLLSKNLINRSGHIRMFAGSIALAAVSILICSLYTDPILWGAMRVLIGFCCACAYTAMESWLNGASTKETRGKILAFYNAVVLGAMFAGQFLINLASPAEAILFVLAGIILCLAVVPMAWSRQRGPEVSDTESMSITALFKRSPLGVVACFTSGIIYSAVFNLVPLFASHYGITGFDLSLYAGSAILGAFLLQFPVGYLSDRFDRRSVLFMALLLSSAVGFSVQVLAEMQWFIAMSVTTAISAGIIACTYPLSISEVFDKLKQSEMVAAMGSLIMAFSIGGAFGPYGVSLVMRQFGNDALFYFLGCIQLMLAAFVVLQMRVRTALPAEEQENFVMQSGAVPAGVNLDPRTEYVEAIMPLSPEAQTAVEIAEQDPATAVRMAKALVVAKPEQGVEIAAEVAKVDGVDPLRLYEVMLETVPDQILEVTSAMVKATPDLAYELVRKLAEAAPDEVVSVAAEIGRTLPELRIDMARVAVESAPESAVEVAEYYAQVMSEERASVRPADREDDTSEQDAADLVSQLSELAPEHTIEMATTIVEAVPDSAVNVATEVASSLPEWGSEDLSREHVINDQDAAELVTRLAEAAPEHAMDIGVAVVEAQPEAAVAIATEYANTISERQTESEDPHNEKNLEDSTSISAQADEETCSFGPEENTVVDTERRVVQSSERDTEEMNVSSDSIDNSSESNISQEAVELVNRLSEAAPDQAVDIGAAVVEAVPESASGVVEALVESDQIQDSDLVSDLSDRPNSDRPNQSGADQGLDHRNTSQSGGEK